MDNITITIIFSALVVHIIILTIVVYVLGKKLEDTVPKSHVAAYVHHIESLHNQNEALRSMVDTYRNIIINHRMPPANPTSDFTEPS